MHKKIFLIMLFSFSFKNVYADNNGLVEQNGDLFYYLNGNIMKNYWLDANIDGKYDYYFGKDGKAVDGVQLIDNSYYYFVDNKIQYGKSDGTYYYGNYSGKRQYNYWWDFDKDGKNDSYFGNDGKVVNDVQLIDNSYYYFVDNKIQYGKSDGTYYYGNYSGKRQYNYWWDFDKDGKNDSYFGNDGKVVNDVQLIDNSYYYFVDNKLQYGKSDGIYYYGNYSGKRQYNYLWDENKDGIIDYYFGSDGRKYINIWLDVDSNGQNDYYFGNDGKAVDGVQLIDDTYYYFVDNKLQYGKSDGTYYYGNYSGKRQYNYWWDFDKDGKNDSYFGNDGKVVNDVQLIDNSYYYFVDNKLQYGKSDGTYYYGNYSGKRQYNYLWDENKDGIIDYYFNFTGEMVINYWYDINNDNKNDYYFGEEGKSFDGIKLIDDNFYYFLNCKLQYGKSDGTYYYGNYSGKRQYNYWWDENKDEKNDYYFGEDGKKVTGLQIIDNYNYYFDANGKLQYGKFILIDGKKYYFGNFTGKKQYGWLYKNNMVYYLNEETGEVMTGKVLIDDVIYEFNNDGTWKAGWVTKSGKKFYYYLDGSKAVGWVNIAGTKCFFNTDGELIQDNALKIIDVSSHQGNIDWNVVSNTNVDGSIVRIGYGTSYVTDAPVIDSYFDRNLNGSISNKLLFGTYIYSYAIDAVSASIEADFVINNLNLRNYDKNKIVFYDLEENAWTKNLNSNDYDIIISTFINKLSSNGYKVKVYTYKYLAENKLSDYGRGNLGWIAQYNSNCTYSYHYDGWQYSDKESINGINGNVDVSVFKK